MTSQDEELGRFKGEPWKDDPVFETEEEAQEFWEKRDAEESTISSKINKSGRSGTVDWCSCTGCQPMPTDEESYCCQEIDESNVRVPSGIPNF